LKGDTRDAVTRFASSRGEHWEAWGEAEQAMENCYRKACRQPKRFTSDGDFGSWIIRLLINEIVLVANQRRFESSELSEAEYPEAR